MGIDQIFLLQNNNFASSGVEVCGIDFVRLLDDCERIGQTNIAKFELKLKRKIKIYREASGKAIFTVTFSITALS